MSFTALLRRFQLHFRHQKRGTRLHEMLRRNRYERHISTFGAESQMEMYYFTSFSEIGPFSVCLTEVRWKAQLLTRRMVGQTPESDFLWPVWKLMKSSRFQIILFAFSFQSNSSIQKCYERLQAVLFRRSRISFRALQRTFNQHDTHDRRK